MEDTPKVSVCIPVYNCMNYIGEAIDSILYQTYQNFELIITDNCSTDETPIIIKKYELKDNRVKYYRNNKNLGVIGNINRGILLSKAQYVKILCSDDKVLPQFLEVFVEKMDKHPDVSLITSYTKSFGDVEHIRNGAYFPGTGELDGKKYQKNLLINGNWPGSPSSTMFRRKHLHMGLFDVSWRYWLGDLDMWIRLLGVGNAYVVPEILSYLRIHGEQESSIHAMDFRLIKERLMLANRAFQFQHVYGKYSKKEQNTIHYHLLKRLVREGLGKKGLEAKIGMFKIGLSRLSYSKSIFLLLVLKNLHRLFRCSRFN